MITIQNQGRKRNGQTRYTIYINNEFIAEFWHISEYGLGRCLLEASKAVERNKWALLKKIEEDK